MGYGEWDISNEAIGQRLARARLARGMKPGAVATALAITPQRWNNYESGRTPPPVGILLRFWQVTGATSDYVLFNRKDGLPLELARRIDEIELADAARKAG